MLSKATQKCGTILCNVKKVGEKQVGHFVNWKDVQYVVLGPRKSAMRLVRDFSENDKIFRREKKYVE